MHVDYFYEDDDRNHAWAADHHVRPPGMRGWRLWLVQENGDTQSEIGLEAGSLPRRIDCPDITGGTRGRGCFCEAAHRAGRAITGAISLAALEANSRTTRLYGEKGSGVRKGQ
jgi:hypothetical protein